MLKELSDNQLYTKIKRKKMLSAFLCYSNFLLFIGNIFIFVATLLLKQPKLAALLLIPVFYLIFKTFKSELIIQNKLLSDEDYTAMKKYLRGDEDANT